MTSKRSKQTFHHAFRWGRALMAGALLAMSASNAEMFAEQAPKQKLFTPGRKTARECIAEILWNQPDVLV